MAKGIIVLEDGTVASGVGLGTEKEIFGEIVFNTSMTGYQEAFTDPSYAGQILVMTYPLIGNYGFHRKLCESETVKIRGLVIKEPAFFSSRGKKVTDYLSEAGIPAITQVDTRSLTLKIRYYGTMKAILVNTSKDIDINELIKTVRKRSHPDTENLVKKVTCSKIIYHHRARKKRIILIDCGVKNSIISNLLELSQVIQVPYDITYDQIMKLKPHGIVVSNGPGNPEHPEILKKTVKIIKSLIGKYPVFGICLGHQLLGIALGCQTYKLKFGHRGYNHSVKDLKTGKVYMTSQNHGYAIKPDPHLKEIDFDWFNVNDATVEGISHKHLPIFSVQFHPEASPGPLDTSFLFKKFIEMVDAQAH